MLTYFSLFSIRSRVTRIALISFWPWRPRSLPYYTSYLLQPDQVGQVLHVDRVGLQQNKHKYNWQHYKQKYWLTKIYLLSYCLEYYINGDAIYGFEWKYAKVFICFLTLNNKTCPICEWWVIDEVCGDRNSRGETLIFYIVYWVFVNHPLILDLLEVEHIASYMVDTKVFHP